MHQLRHARGHNVKRCTCTDTRHHRHAGRWTGRGSRHIIIMYIRVRPLLWIHVRRCNISQTMPARRGQLLPSADRWQVLHPMHLLRGAASPPAQGQPDTLHPARQSSGRSTAGGAEPLAATAVSLFGLSPDSQ